MKVPVALFVFRRLDTVKMIIDCLREAACEKLYIFSDGARADREDEKKKVEEVRQYLRNAIDWDCTAEYVFAPKNKGCAANICDGITSVFEKEEAAIILEDDAVPVKEFFPYCETLLKKYENNKNIIYIAGFNATGEKEVIPDSYCFSRSAPMSGAIAMWADRWQTCDFSMKNWPDNYRSHKLRGDFYTREIYRLHCNAFSDAYKGLNDGWDYQVHHHMLDTGSFAIVPKWNLVKSYGFTEGAFHPQSKREAENLKKIMSPVGREFICPMTEPEAIVLNKEYDKLRQRYLLSVSGNYLQRHIHYAKRKIKDLAYKMMPAFLWKFMKRMFGK